MQNLFLVHQEVTVDEFGVRILRMQMSQISIDRHHIVVAVGIERMVFFMEQAVILLLTKVEWLCCSTDFSSLANVCAYAWHFLFPRTHSMRLSLGHHEHGS